MAKFREHIISHGDTLQSISQRYLGDMSRWVELVNFNNLKYPYIVDTLEEKMMNPEHLVTVGDTILIQDYNDSQAELIASLRRATEYDRDEIYGLALGKDLDVMPKNSSARDTEILELKGDRGDVATVKGFDNLKQALFIRIITPLGSYVGHPDYGSEVHKYLGKKNTEENATLLDLEIERTLRKDGRVQNVISNGHELDGTSYTGSFTIQTLGLTEAFEFVLEAQANGPIVLRDSMR